MEKPQDLWPIAFFLDRTASPFLPRAHAILERHWLKSCLRPVLVQLYTRTTSKIGTIAMLHTGSGTEHIEEYKKQHIRQRNDTPFMTVSSRTQNILLRT